MFAARFDRHMVAEARLGQLDMAAGETVLGGVILWKALLMVTLPQLPDDIEIGKVQAPSCHSLSTGYGYSAALAATGGTSTSQSDGRKRFNFVDDKV